MNKANMVDKLNDLIIQEARGIDKQYIFHDETDLVDDLGYDSISIIQLIVNIETEFEFDFGDNDIIIDNLITYSKLKEYVCKRIDN